MKQVKNLFWFATIALAIVISLTGCKNPLDDAGPNPVTIAALQGGNGQGGNGDGGGGSQGGGGGGENDTIPTFTSVSEFAAYLTGKPANTAGTSYRVKLNIKDEDYGRP
jgi:pectate lyase